VINQCTYSVAVINQCTYSVAVGRMVDGWMGIATVLSRLADNQ